ncbi:hypothetical protein OG782_01990 [Streptomyces sp. NBC_00876]|uniref:sulfurtransferase TusA family protein n=1 Tax=Streptomyces sp. NBC_00876 TaxID=2975853 RepID=UPI00386B6C7A|nr:hypothetical protein OG782_01990 [Streptomyces sp. NBC_00876]
MCAASFPAPSGPDDAVRAVVDAGGEPWARILGLLERRCRDLPVGGVLELHSANPVVRASLHEWCRLTGSTLLSEEASGERSTYRIEPAPPARGTPHPSPLQNPESS